MGVDFTTETVCTTTWTTSLFRTDVQISAGHFDGDDQTHLLGLYTACFWSWRTGFKDHLVQRRNSARATAWTWLPSQAGKGHVSTYVRMHFPLFV